MRPASTPLLLGSLALLLSGCNLLIPAIFLHPGTKKVPAEFAQLKDKTVAVMVWAEPETLYDYPYVRLELASYVSDQIRAHLPGVTMIDQRKIEEFIERSPQAALDPDLVGEQFEAQMVVYIELLEFQMRDPDAPALLQGRIQASVSVYDLNAELGDPALFELEGVETLHPSQPALFSTTAAYIVRSDTYAKFADQVARKFYTHDEKL